MKIFWLKIILIVLIWGTAFVSWWAYLWHFQAFARMGAELPLLSAFVWQAMQWKIPFFWAGLFTGGILYAQWQTEQQTALITIAFMILTILFLLIIIIAMTLPMIPMCGELLPDCSSLKSGM